MKRELQADYTYNPQRRCEAWSFAMAECQTVGEAGASSTKVRSVELRNLYRVKFNDAGEIPQRRCEAWSFAMILPLSSA